ncbi:uncharacterized protein PHACADRAFT_247190 [Phanerochaete carnosa HHB-10118-sp]|uniref:Uncharacterized protein n=1 Tax=Phanerochaete carnosa (strain HHB-10118-sp) TaxID=650164 RepID=K5XD56_PHACS|nr:uncharacterized protein PHACADRAFT_247190 [Phanerochaete carnosa HHB-10118-sp]EKM60947.1 hypothetical protein PHACADRAFT_247190 [Phanerochaete carnosa HHB-10118-sp]
MQWNTRPAGRGKSQTVRDLDEELAQSTRELVLSLPAIQRQKEKAAATSIFSGHRSGVGRSTYDTHPTKTGRVWSKVDFFSYSEFSLLNFELSSRVCIHRHII